MAKRGEISLTGGHPRFRVSRPGVDVDSATSEDFLAHEDFTFSQPFASGYVACPFAGASGLSARIEPVTVNVPDVGTTPLVFIYGVADTTGKIMYPSLTSAGALWFTGSYYVEGWDIAVDTSVPGELTLYFRKNADSFYTPRGCYYMLMRHADV